MSQQRFVRRDRRIYDFSACACCGTCWGGPMSGAKEGRKCNITTCLCCGSPQCMGNGLARGTCSICLVGLLTGWAGNSTRLCGYKNCGKPAVAHAKRVKYVCKDHLKRAGIDLEETYKRRAKEWELVNN